MTARAKNKTADKAERLEGDLPDLLKDISLPVNLSEGAASVSDLTLEQALGVQVRAMRRRLGITVSELAASAGLSGGMLSKIENGQISPSLSSLQALAKALNVPITTFFSTFEERRDCSFVPAGNGVIIERRGSRVGHEYSLLGHAMGGQMAIEPYLITLHEGAAPYPAFQHVGREFIYMLSGEVMYRHGDQSYHLRPGDALLFDSAAPHGPEKLLVQPMKYLSIMSYMREAS
ncbi:MAG TPA: helix-turn-helix domain-containing protein [Acidocella sp.]|jgi:transcriptional regulator with XRE-family HTH domain|uniref:helix-turn-helix domain-containing protein n=1 Tax=Acidocella sp. TaxID=50710 RepID=UPI002B780372|nr:helix-turn-helix domain-containing protein [Acidocella sp.]HVE21467.1 helix-turn-helix domain-containing protein [Acidocella sp.]